MGDEYECGICGRAFGRKSNMIDHQKNCGIVKLSKFGINESVFNKVRNFDKPNGTESTQLKLGQNVEGLCTNCGTKLTSDDSYKGMDTYLECPNCSNVLNQNML